MGFFSWLTADTQESIPVSISPRHKGRTVYMLQPGDEPALAEPQYYGDGVFDGENAYVWLARHHMTSEQIAEIEKQADGNPDLLDRLMHMVGVSIEMGKYYVHRDTGEKYSVFHPVHPATGVEVTHINATYDQPVKEFGGLKPNEAIESGLLIQHDVPEPRFPLKFSFDPNAVYEDLPASRICPNQGIYYDDDEDNDEAG